jgi:hypothetical protein
MIRITGTKKVCGKENKFRATTMMRNKVYKTNIQQRKVTI